MVCTPCFAVYLYQIVAHTPQKAIFKHAIIFWQKFIIIIYKFKKWNADAFHFIYNNLLPFYKVLLPDEKVEEFSVVI